MNRNHADGDYDREALTEMLIAGEAVIPGTDRERLIDASFLYSHEWDVAKALTERFTPAWRKRNYAAARREAELWRKEARDSGEPEERLAGIDAASIFARRFQLEMREIRLGANAEIAHCWVRLLKHRPEYADRCPWQVFQGDRIWQTLQDVELLHAVGCTALQLAEKMDLRAMSQPDWDEVLKIVPELASRRSKYDCCVG